MAYIATCQRANARVAVPSTTKKLNGRQAHFVRIYLGRDTRYHGNATASYKRAYDCTNERVAQVSGSRLTHKPHIAALIETARKKAEQALIADATFVLEQSIRLYDRAMGDAAVEVDHIDKHGNVSVIERREYNPAIAKGALELIGRHTTVQAFQDNIEHNHTHRLERALAKAHQSIEANAVPRDITAQGEVIENTRHTPDTPQIEKRVHQAGGQAPGPIAPEKTSSERAGATGK